MKFVTTRFGEIDVSNEDIVQFPEGLLGFNEFHRFVILNSQEGSPFRWLQSLDDGNLAFIIIEPLNFLFSYDLDLADSDAAFLGLERAEDAVLYSIVTVPENVRDMTANLQGPLVINAINRKGRQVISSNATHSIKANIVEEMAKREKKLSEVMGSLDSKKLEDKR
ncbi:MAG: flagellar assembly protein FliW [Candidatus Riflebacteria bacterium]|nr:flagellar assembly protein FliW [Candidatus Riflebacteria bacterium]